MKKALGLVGGLLVLGGLGLYGWQHAQGPLLTFGPAVTPSQIEDLCEQITLTGDSGFCFRGDGGSVASSLVMVDSGTPVTETLTQLPCGPAGCPVMNQTLDGTASYFSTAAAPSPVGDFSACVRFRTNSSTSATQDLLTKHTALATADALRISTDNTNVTFTVYKDGVSSTSVTATPVVWGAWHLACVTYDFVADGSSVLTPYLDGVAGTASNTAVGPPLVESSAWFLGNRDAVFTLGAFQGAFVTETLLSAAQIANLAKISGVFASTTAQGSFGEASTWVHTTFSGCNAADGTYNKLPTARPCVNVGLLPYRSYTNLLLRSEQLDHASWTSFSENGGVDPTVTADQAYSPQGTLTAERLVFAADASPGTSVRSSSAYNSTSSATAYNYAGIWVKGNGQSGTIYLGEWNSSDQTKCTETACSYTATGWTHCRHNFLWDETTTAKHSLYIGYMSDRGCSTKAVTAADVFVWGAQMGNRVDADYLVTEGSTTANAVSGFSLTNPLSSTDTAWCIGASFDLTVADWSKVSGSSNIWAIGTNAAANSASMTNGTTGKPTLNFRDNANTLMTYTVDNAISAATHQIWGCYNAGVPSIWVDGVLQAGTVTSGSSPRTLTTMPGTLYLGTSSTNAFQAAGMVLYNLQVINRGTP